ncbi:MULTISPECIES: phospholipid scramblase-related protein [Protofrankia]|uniref:Scramblase n=1 Tax=Protofrankia coriariae TaxID=1562887 RepID=A0ABR5F6I0_9ACTN|nr:MULTISPECIES: phospholipid scramblase-related protein [Protofrankia]KLL12338.1 Scramblase [Protofrankia coriariae]ONH37876.1 Scramblase [Protofrankia sp. BMG5.30]
MTQTTPPAGWYADPSGQHGFRYWDGTTWTDQVSDVPSGQPESPGKTAPAQGWGTPQGYQNAPVQTNYTPDRVQRQVSEGAGVRPVHGGGGTLFTEPVLVVNQKTKLIELTNEYAVFDQAGNQIGSVVEVGQSALKKAVRFVSSLDQFFTHRLEVRDSAGVAHLVLTRPAKVFRSRVIVTRPDGFEIGQIVQQNIFGKIRFALETGGTPIGTIKTENWRAWNFSIVDHGGTEIARVTKTWEGLARTLFTTADNYVVQIHRPLTDPLRSLVVASALTIDTALKQDSRGLG